MVTSSTSAIGAPPPRVVWMVWDEPWRRDGPSGAVGLGEALACPEQSRELLQDGGDAQIIGVVSVGALRGGVAEPPGQAALVEQPGRLLD